MSQYRNNTSKEQVDDAEPKPADEISADQE